MKKKKKSDESDELDEFVCIFVFYYEKKSIMAQRNKHIHIVESEKFFILYMSIK